MQSQPVNVMHSTMVGTLMPTQQAMVSPQVVYMQQSSPMITSIPATNYIGGVPIARYYWYAIRTLLRTLVKSFLNNWIRKLVLEIIFKVNEYYIITLCSSSWSPLIRLVDVWHNRPSANAWRPTYYTYCTSYTCRPDYRAVWATRSSCPPRTPPNTSSLPPVPAAPPWQAAH